MASLAQWTAWKDEYIVGLRQIIDDAPYALAKILTTPGHTFELTAAKKIVKEAEENGFLDKNDPLYFWKAAFFSSSKLASLQDGYQLFLEVINDSYNSKDYQHFIHNTFSGYYTIVLYGLFKPLIKVCRYLRVAL